MRIGAVEGWRSQRRVQRRVAQAPWARTRPRAQHQQAVGVQGERQVVQHADHRARLAASRRSRRTTRPGAAGRGGWSARRAAAPARRQRQHAGEHHALALAARQRVQRGARPRRRTRWPPSPRRPPRSSAGPGRRTGRVRQPAERHLCAPSVSPPASPCCASQAMRRARSARGHGVQLAAVEAHAAGGRATQAGEGAQQRRLAGAVRADHRRPAAGAQRERHAVQHRRGRRGRRAGRRAAAAQALMPRRPRCSSHSR